MASDSLRAEVESFLYREAELLDGWALEQWTALFSDDCAYLIPTTDLPPDASPRTSLFYVADDHHRLCERAKRLMKNTAYAESPHSRLRRTIANVRIDDERDGEIAARCNFVAARTRFGDTITYFGEIRYRLIRSEGGLRIREKRVLLDHDGLRPHGRISAPL